MASTVAHFKAKAKLSVAVAQDTKKNSSPKAKQKTSNIDIKDYN